MGHGAAVGCHLGFVVLGVVACFEVDDPGFGRCDDDAVGPGVGAAVGEVAFVFDAVGRVEEAAGEGVGHYAVGEEGEALELVGEEGVCGCEAGYGAVGVGGVDYGGEEVVGVGAEADFAFLERGEGLRGGGGYGDAGCPVE